jgi:hypothetical protein
MLWRAGYSVFSWTQGTIGLLKIYCTYKTSVLERSSRERSGYERSGIRKVRDTKGPAAHEASISKEGLAFLLSLKTAPSSPPLLANICKASMLFRENED